MDIRKPAEQMVTKGLLVQMVMLPVLLVGFVPTTEMAPAFSIKDSLLQLTNIMLNTKIEYTICMNLFFTFSYLNCL